ncbi:MAG: tetratricopeptide repeat protein [Acidobacteriaceae bacterium]
MRYFSQWIVAMALLGSAACLAAQTTPLPPGTTSPDDTSAQQAMPNTPSARASALLSPAEDDIARGEYGKALPLLSKILSAPSADSKATARAFYDRGYIEQEQNELSSAEADFRKAVAVDPKQFESRAALGRLLAQQQQWKPAHEELEMAANLMPASGNARQAVANADRTLARVDAQMYDASAASDALIAALKLTPEQPDDTLFAAQLAAESGNQADAENEYRKALAADPRSIPAAEGLGRALIRQDKFADAEPVLQQALHQESNDPVLLAELAAALAGQGNSEAATAQLEALHRQNPDQPAVTRMLADLYSSAGASAKAAPLYQQLLAADPRNPDLLTAAAENLVLEQQWASAVQTFEESLNTQPAQADAWSGLAFAASQNHQYALALTALDHRQQYLADGPGTLFLRADALDHLHREKEAAVFYRKFLSESQGKFPNEDAQARQRLKALGK